MIHILWSGMLLIAVVFSVLNHRVGETLSAAAEGAKAAVNLSILMAGTMAFWMGLSRIAEAGGITKQIAKLLSPLLKRLFPRYGQKKDVLEKITLNITANLFGLGNAATPLGLQAMRAMDDRGSAPHREVILFVVINTASLQLIPTNMAALRSAAGSREPFAVLPCILLTSLGALTVSILSCKLLERLHPWEE